MAGFAFSTDGNHGSGEGVRNPTTDRGSKEVMLRGELRDEIEIQEIECRMDTERSVPERVIVRQRINTYYGPKLRVESETGQEYLITAPGPDSYLLLWAGKLNKRGTREEWIKLAEVRAVLNDNGGGYHLCQQCNEPLKTADHQRLAAIGRCPNVS